MSESEGSRNGSRQKKQSLFLAIVIRGVNTLEIIGHAQERMAERGVTQDDVIQTLLKPDEERPLADQPGRWEAFRNKTAKLKVKVVFEPLPDRVRVITAIMIKRRIVERE